MEQPKVFMSVGSYSTTQQNEFIECIQKRLSSENLNPNTVGRNKFGSESPLKTVKDLMDECAGMLVIALERTYFEKGIEKRGGPRETNLSITKFATPWNQIESAMAYTRGLPILVILENGVKAEGLLEKGYDWYVMNVDPTPNLLMTDEFNGVLSSWKTKVEQFNSNRQKIAETKTKIDPTELTIGELITNLKPAQLWSMLAAIAALLTGVFFIGRHFPA